ncbi:CLUMA_CG009817, isoform A [Clunio marinus]|uniref:CLUMA_CG009817, isoform A n=1 Tax=Clunio marinus TaxID=568069 RepID=A0A1J1I807_9DIPT|nr:CLUMA_CG009817, isoform A [Clunio marinus]
MEGCVVFGTISHFESCDQFYIVIDGTVPSIEIKTDELVQIWWIPSIFDQFLVRSGNEFFRCTRLPLSDETLDPLICMTLYLFDTGEKFNMAICDMDLDMMYILPDNLKESPALAKRCKLNKLRIDHDFDDEASFLMNNIHQKFTFEVVAVRNDDMKVNVYPIWNHKLIDDTIQEVSKSPPEISKETFTEKQLEIWHEEPLNTENAQLAVQGFVTHDDENLCKFYEPETGGCFKGGRCKQLHIPEIKDGACRDRIKILSLDIPVSFRKPILHSRVSIRVISFYSVNKFWCSYVKRKHTSTESEVKTLMYLMNEQDEVKEYKNIKELPSIHQLVSMESFFVDVSSLMEIVDIQPLPEKSNTAEVAKIILEHQEKCKFLIAIIFENVDGIKCKLYNFDDDDLSQELIGLQLVAEKEIQRPNIDEHETIPV